MVCIEPEFENELNLLFHLMESEPVISKFNDALEERIILDAIVLQYPGITPTLVRKLLEDVFGYSKKQAVKIFKQYGKKMYVIMKMF